MPVEPVVEGRELGQRPIGSHRVIRDQDNPHPIEPTGVAEPQRLCAQSMQRSGIGRSIVSFADQHQQPSTDGQNPFYR